MKLKALSVTLILLFAGCSSPTMNGDIEQNFTIGDVDTPVDVDVSEGVNDAVIISVGEFTDNSRFESEVVVNRGDEYLLIAEENSTVRISQSEYIVENDSKTLYMYVDDKTTNELYLIKSIRTEFL